MGTSKGRNTRKIETPSRIMPTKSSSSITRHRVSNELSPRFLMPAIMGSASPMALTLSAKMLASAMTIMMMAEDIAASRKTSGSWRQFMVR